MSRPKEVVIQAAMEWTRPRRPRPVRWGGASLVLAACLLASSGCLLNHRKVEDLSAAATRGSLRELSLEPQLKTLLTHLRDNPDLPQLVRTVAREVLAAAEEFLAKHPLGPAVAKLINDVVAGVNLEPLLVKVRPALSDLPRVLRRSGEAFGEGFGEGAGRGLGREIERTVARLGRDPQSRQLLAELGRELGREVALGMGQGLREAIRQAVAEEVSPQLERALRTVGREVSLGALEGARIDSLGGASEGGDKRGAAFYLGRAVARGATDDQPGWWKQNSNALFAGLFLLGALLLVLLLLVNVYLLVLVRRLLAASPRPPGAPGP